MQTDIYPDRSQVAAGLLAESHPRDVLVVPIDFAKREHVAHLCRGTGEFVVKRPLAVKNSPAGAQYLLERIDGCCRRLSIPRGNVLIGGEDPPSFTVNFIHALTAARRHVLRVNAKEAKKYRTNTRATSDTLVLNGIAQAILCRRSYDIARMDEIYAVMRQAERSRRRLVRDETAAKNRIHRTCDVLFPDFLNGKASGLTPFTEITLDLMVKDFSVIKIRRTRTETLVKRLQARQVHNPEHVAAKLKSLADMALAPPPEIMPYHSRSLAAKVELLRGIRVALRAEENELARCLVQTPGFLLTSIPGLGIVLAGGIVAEYGDCDAWRSADRMASYGGIVPRQHQSGGTEAEPVIGTLPIDANHHAKDWLLQAAYHVGTTPHPAWRQLRLPGAQHVLYEHYQAVELREGRSRLSTAKRLLRIARAMVRDRRIYLPTNALDPHDPDALPVQQFLHYQQIVIDSLSRKWKGYDLSGIPDEDNWLTRTQEELDALTRLTNGNHN